MRPKWLCVLALAMACGTSSADPGVDSKRVTILGPEGGVAAYSITVVETVRLENWPYVVVPGDELFVDDVILSGDAVNSGDTELWAWDADGREYGIPPGAMMAPGCMTRCSWSGCPEGMGANCHAVMQGDRNCCVCECKVGAYPESCSCSVSNPA